MLCKPVIIRSGYDTLRHNVLTQVGPRYCIISFYVLALVSFVPMCIPTGIEHIGIEEMYF